MTMNLKTAQAEFDASLGTAAIEHIASIFATRFGVGRSDIRIESGPGITRLLLDLS